MTLNNIRIGLGKNLDHTDESYCKRPVLFFGGKGNYKPIAIFLEDLIKVKGHKVWIKIKQKPGVHVHARETFKGGLKIKRKYAPPGQQERVYRAEFSKPEYEIIKQYFPKDNPAA